MIADKETSKRVLGYIGAFMVTMTLVNYSIGWFVVTPNWRIMFAGLCCFFIGTQVRKVLE